MLEPTGTQFEGWGFEMKEPVTFIPAIHDMENTK
jgi:hypothetical protein